MRGMPGESLLSIATAQALGENNCIDTVSIEDQ